MFRKPTRKLKKLISGILIGLGLGILSILFLPINVWLVINGIALIIAGFFYLFKC